MKKHLVKAGAITAAILFLSITAFEFNADARAGGGRSYGGGSRSYSRSASPSPSSSYGQTRQQAAPAPGPFQQQQGGGFLRSMAGGLAGGMLGSMLFSSFAGAGSGVGGMGGGGIGLVQIALLAGVGYLIYRFIKKKRSGSAVPFSRQDGYGQGTVIPLPGAQQDGQPATDDPGTGLSHIRRMDPAFDENRFADAAMDTFFKIQGAWMNRGLSPVAGLLTDEMKGIFQTDLDRLLRDKQINRLENIAVREVRIAEAWQEAGQDYITASIYANLLDYTTDETTGAVLSGSKVEPVKFEEFWTFTRPVGANPWRLAAINQA
ncbi:Tim44 domain-containing protein [Geobacter sp. FeAm09]|uniref:TIM44-like domain-containing protein n=1 Tax=Geobacter sp. FeAm09 TaxID=2597769 RepID=UPI0011ED8CCE|nr:TIM44-like domain-containing protein [Geobacter sp. FeAm09]QEM67467.1 Tim44 domain-containing protein [Geobacter sp. FeAm09]